jgi:hypothetical protein
LKAQVYHPFVRDSVFWNIFHIYEDAPPRSYDYQMAMAGDTVILRKNYKKLYVVAGNEWQVQGYVREEEKRVYYRPGTDSSEMLLYDFNINVGDTFKTVKMLGSTFQTVSCYVSKVDSVRLENAEFRKSYSLDWMKGDICLPHLWIEGIGGTAYPDYILDRCEGGYEGLNCVFDKGNLIWHSQYTSDCRLNIGIAPELTISAPCIFPNPANEYLHINNIPSGKGFSYTISDCLGRMKLEGSISEPDQSVNLEGLNAGIYFLNLRQAFGQGDYYYTFLKE